MPEPSNARALDRLSHHRYHLAPSLISHAAASRPLPAVRFEASIVAGAFGKPGASGDGGPATGALLNNPFGVIRGPDKAIYICEYDGECVRRVGTDGTISTVAGCGRTGGAGDGGPALEAEFNKPHEIRFDGAGDLFVVERDGHRVRKIDMRTKTVSTVVGTGEAGFSGNGFRIKNDELWMNDDEICIKKDEFCI